jgi:hypothetical protein
MIAGILLIIAGILALSLWIQLFTIDIELIETVVNTSYIDELDVNITSDQIKQGYTICGTIGIIASVLAFLGGVLAIKRKRWLIAFASGIPQLGLSLILLMFAIVLELAIITVFSFLGVVLIFITKSEFQ